MELSIAIITARGGSKRIPKKNIKEFCGRPIISYSIEAALDSGIFDEVMVSTDSEEIADIARKYGANVPFMRSKKNSDDYATTRDVILEVLQRYKNVEKEFKYATCIYPTAPFITAERLREAYELMKKYNPVEVTPVVEFSYPPQRSYVIDRDNKIKYKYPEYMHVRSQDLEKFYHDAGQFYVYNVKKYLNLEGNISEKKIPIVLDELEVQDIDNETDWKIAEMKYVILKNISR